MSIDWSSYAIVGLAIPMSKLEQGKKKVKAFKHDYDESMVYCPKTGKKLWEEVTEYIPEYNRDESKLGEYKVLHQEDDEVIIALDYTSTGKYDSYCEFMNLPSSPDVAKFKKYMEYLGLWDFDEFGIYNILECC